MHVLIIHGNGGLAATWQRHLEMLDAQVTQARTSVAALAALETVIFDVIVLDVMLDGASQFTDINACVVLRGVARAMAAWRDRRTPYSSSRIAHKAKGAPRARALEDFQSE